MKVCGFTFVRNAVKYDYPVIASITSVLPVVDKFIVSVGNCDDGTLELISSIGSPKIEIVHSTWDDSLKEGGRVLAAETDKAFAQVPDDYQWAFYLQADEVIHENDLPLVLDAMKKYLHNEKVEGLLFDYLHFYGTYDYTGDSRRWYKHEIRIIRNNKKIYSYRDAQGFRINNNKKLAVKKIPATVYHYGWVRHPNRQLEKIRNFYGLWNGDSYVAPTVGKEEVFDFSADIDSLALFTGSHPAVMKERIDRKNWQARLDTRKKQFSIKDRLLYSVEKITGKRLFDYKNYRII